MVLGKVSFFVLFLYDVAVMTFALVPASILSDSRGAIARRRSRQRDPVYLLPAWIAAFAIAPAGYSHKLAHWLSGIGSEAKLSYPIRTSSVMPTHDFTESQSKTDEDFLGELFRFVAIKYSFVKRIGNGRRQALGNAMFERKLRNVLIAGLAFALVSVSGEAASAASDGKSANREKIVVGLVENIRLDLVDGKIKAKIDSGAKSSSIDVESYSIVARSFKKWVRFSIRLAENKVVDVEQPLLRIAKIRRAGMAKVERPVVLMGICLGGVYKKTEVNLETRTGMNYRVLIGRQFLGAIHRAVSTCPPRRIVA